MHEPKTPGDEAERIGALERCGLLDSAPEARFDRVTRLARQLFDVPIALVSLVDKDRQWFKSKSGLDVPETSREVSFCGHAILQSQILLVPDAAEDERFSDNPLVLSQPRIRFYAGCPIVTEGGHRLGTLCLIDRVRRTLDAEQLQSLRDLASIVQEEINSNDLATLDSLTGLSNRRGFEIAARRSIGICRRVGAPLSLLYFDLDNLKPVNDNCGHAEGDRMLVAFANALRRTFRSSDVLARVGGDEFCALTAPGVTCDWALLRERLEEESRLESERCELPYGLAFSTGRVALSAGQDVCVDELVRSADAAMYEDKRARRSSGNHHLRLPPFERRKSQG